MDGQSGGQLMEWEVIHYWMQIEDEFKGKRQEWVQFVIHTKTASIKLNLAKVVVREDDDGKPGRILSRWNCDVENARQLWGHYLTKQKGLFMPHMTETRSDFQKIIN
jgi:hypothetical protein